MSAEKQIIQQAVILIPSLEPDKRLPLYIRRLEESGFGAIVVVDDGSGAGSRDVFQEVSMIPRTVVLYHETNRGKGAALRTGFSYIRDLPETFKYIITADSDGQHTAKDCIRLAERLSDGQRKLYLGSRDFNLPDIPPKSRIGNRITSIVFKFLYGQWLPDTQTGLRAFRREELPFMTEIDGDRYEYEMKVLIACARSGIPIASVPIETIYENGNEGTHFHPVRDSWRIYRVVFGSFFRFMGSSFFCWLLDYLLTLILWGVVLPAWGLPPESIWNVNVGGWSARLVSSAINFTLNKKLVFRQKGKAGSALIRYAAICVFVITVSNIGVWLMGLIGIARWLAKIIMETVLYFFNYHFQRTWVFREAEIK